MKHEHAFCLLVRNGPDPRAITCRHIKEATKWANEQLDLGTQVVIMMEYPYYIERRMDRKTRSWNPPFEPQPMKLAKLLDEQTEEQNAVLPVELQDISLDRKVDKYFIQYEREAVPESQEYDKYLKEILSEADDAAGPPDMPPDMGDPGAGGEPPAEAAPAPEATPLPRINLQTFARSLARLINNYEALLSPKSVILNRARAYIEKNYNPNTAKELMILLDISYNLTPEPKERQDEHPVPLATGAAASGGGAGG